MNLIVKNPDGTTLMPAVGVVGSKWVEPLDLTQTGTYTIKVDPQSFAKGSQTVTAWTFHGDLTANTPANGSTHTFNLATPGQNGSLYVSASNGDRLSFTFTGVSDAPGKMWIKNPDGTVLVPTQTLSGSGAMVEPVVVDQTGDYHVFLNPQADAPARSPCAPTRCRRTWSTTWPPTARPTRAVHDPGPERKIRFSGSAGQEVSINLGSSVADTDFQILKPNGNELTRARSTPRATSSSRSRSPSTGCTSSCSIRRASPSECHHHGLYGPGRRNRRPERSARRR